ncbi:MAG: hypothetical protein VKL59_01430 [Nostocaceae cyanobacterium]|nr:hypothetical protein [Nostocaceae cyanobacterium]
MNSKAFVDLAAYNTFKNSHALPVNLANADAQAMNMLTNNAAKPASQKTIVRVYYNNPVATGAIAQITAQVYVGSMGITYSGETVLPNP